MKNNSLQKGFTLIELLVVIAIIAILSAITIVALNSARAKAINGRVQSEMSDLGAQLELYYDDNGNYGPGANQCNQEPFSGGATDDATTLMTAILKDTNTNSDTCAANGQSWTVLVTLNGGGTWCSDSNGDSGPQYTSITTNGQTNEVECFPQ